MIKNLLLWLMIALFLAAIFGNGLQLVPPSTKINYSTFIKEVNQGGIASVTIDGYTIRGKYSNGESFTTTRPAAQDSQLMDDLFRNNVEIKGVEPQQQGFLRQLLVAAFPVLLLFGILFFAMRGMQGRGMMGGGNPTSFGRSRARALSKDEVKTTFKDVAGIDEAKEEVGELVEFLRDPGKFSKLGARIPRGVLMCGPPGTGKTLLAKAIAGEADVPFFSISGSDFVEMFVGVGASRVRDMFAQAKKQSPCIIFIDEIDAVGRHRGAGLGGGHDEREQTLNQLLVEMDGFEGKEGIIIIAATNRPDVLDPALLRPGRFDRQVIVPLPDVKGRTDILKVHLKKVKKDPTLDPALIARGTPGFSGADLANLVNEAALFSAREKKTRVGMHELDLAKDKIMMGSERKSMAMSQSEKKLTAYHESGHAIVGLNVPEHDPIYKVTIIPRGRALGLTMFLPERDKYSLSKTALKSQLCSLYGGRVAEELVFGKEAITTGASNDIERATEMARAMVTKWGFSQELGPQKYDDDEEAVFLGRRAAVQSNLHISEETNKKIDREIHKILSESYARAQAILQKNIKILHLMAESLMQYETITEKQIQAVMAGKTPPPPPNWDAEEKEKPKKTAKKVGKGRSTVAAGSGPSVPVATRDRS